MPLSDKSDIGELLPDDCRVFRAFSEKGYRERKATKNKVRYLAYMLREEDIADGLSVGLSPKAAVKHLDSNEGCCSILVGTVHGLPFKLEVRSDLKDPEHAFICNLPWEGISDEHRQKANLIAGILARASEDIICDPIPKS